MGTSAIPNQVSDGDISDVSADKFTSGTVPDGEYVAFQDGAGAALADFGDSWIYGSSALGALFISPKVDEDASLLLGTSSYTWASIYMRSASTISINSEDGTINLPTLKSGTTQGGAGASAGDIWHDTTDDSLKIGV